MKTNSIKDKAITSMHAVGTIIDSENTCILLGEERIEKDWKPTWKAIKARLKKSFEEKRKEEYLEKQMQGGYCESRMKDIIYDWGKSYTKKDCLGVDYTGKNGWNEIMEKFKSIRRM